MRPSRPEADPDGQEDPAGGTPEFAPTAIRFIKLGQGGEWEERCLLHDQTLMLDYRSGQHTESLEGDWEEVEREWLKKRGGKAGVAKSDVRQIRDFYTLPETCLWITFHARHLYWCFAHAEVEELSGGERVRKAVGGWKRQTLTGQPLRFENLDGRVTKVQGYKGTICTIELEGYLVRKIRGEVQPDVRAAAGARDVLIDRITSLISGLWWKDFELLADLIFTRAGWQRVSVLGKAEKDLDLDLIEPVSGRRAFVQVKSSATLQDLRNSIAQYQSYDDFHEMYFVVHTADAAIRNQALNGVTVIDRPKLAELVLSSGLVDWLIAKRS